MADTLKFLLMCLILTFMGCAVARISKKSYQAMYCNQMQPDGKHCAVWATPCGRLECGK